MNRILGFIYKVLRGFLHWHEEREIPITIIELAVAVFGTLHFYEALLEFLEEKVLNTQALGVGLGEFLIFLMLSISIFARLAVILRARSLGMDFGGLFSGRGHELNDQLYDDVAALGPRDDFLGSQISAAANTRKSVLDHIAHESATRFSIRTYGEADTMWKTWEERYLSDWLSRFPGAIWRLAPDDPKAGEDSGYFSIAVPVTEDAWKKVRFGHLSTALCALDEEAVAYFNSSREEPFSRPIFIVFYTLIYVPTRLKGDKSSPLKLLYCGVEHLAYLLSQFYPAPCTEDTASMSVVCESPNASLETVLRTFGFAPVLTDFDLELEHTHIRKSVAGFHLFEIGYSHGAPSVGDKPRAARFLDLLCEIARRKPQPVRPRYDVERDSEMTMVRRTH